MTADNNHPSQMALLVFLRVPEKGRVKTRLAKKLGDEKALALYRCFVKDTLQNIRSTEHLPILCYHPSDKQAFIRQCLGERYDYWPQEGATLGEKMANGFIKAFKNGFDRVVILGTDVPDLPHRFINKAFDALKTSHAVIGPSKDGGYYLIGFQANGFLPAVFENMPWGSDQVLGSTLAVFKKGPETVFLLPVWQDIDEKEDLEALIKRHDGGRTASSTMALAQDIFTI